MIGFLILLALIWMIIASYTDLKEREVPNWLNFSLIIFALAYRAFYSVLSWNLWFFVYGLLGFLVFVLLAYAFYYARVFAGGDAKLLMGLGFILPFSSFFYENLLILAFFVFLLLLAGGVYGLLFSFILVLKNKEKFVREFNKQFRKRKNLIFIGLFFSLLFLIFPFYLKDSFLLLLPGIIIVFPFLFVYGKSVEESCMVVEISGKKLTVGDWLYQEVRIGKRKIKPNWEGLDEDEVKLLRNIRKVKIKQGIPFVPSFLIAFILLLVLRNYFLNLLLI